MRSLRLGPYASLVAVGGWGLGLGGFDAALGVPEGLAGGLAGC